MMREAEKFLGQLNRTVVYEGLDKTLDTLTNDVGEMNKELPRLNSAASNKIENKKTKKQKIKALN